MKDYGTGGDFQRAAQAATAALTALAGGDIQKALAGASAPYLAQLVKAATMPQDGSKPTAANRRHRISRRMRWATRWWGRW